MAWLHRLKRSVKISTAVWICNEMLKKLSATLLSYTLSLLISCDSVLWGRSYIRNAANIYRWGIFRYIFCAVSAVKNFRVQQESVRRNENVVIHIAYWWEEMLWMNECREWATTALRRLCSDSRTVKLMHNNMHNIHGDRYCTNMETEYWAWHL